MVDLTKEIEEAQAAAQRVAEQEALREKAAQLPALQAERERSRQQQVAERHLEEVAQRVGIRLARVTPRVKAWRERFSALLLEAQELLDELPTLEGEIVASARELAGAHRGLTEIGQPRDYSDPYQIQARQRGQEMPMELRGASPIVSTLWTQAGGADRDLDALGDGVGELLDTETGRVLREAIQRRTFVYTPSRADRFIGRF